MYLLHAIAHTSCCVFDGPVLESIDRTLIVRTCKQFPGGTCRTLIHLQDHSWPCGNRRCLSKQSCGLPVDLQHKKKSN